MFNFIFPSKSTSVQPQPELSPLEREEKALARKRAEAELEKRRLDRKAIIRKRMVRSMLEMEELGLLPEQMDALRDSDRESDTSLFKTMRDFGL